MKKVLMPLPPQEWGGLHAFVATIAGPLQQSGWETSVLVPDNANDIVGRLQVPGKIYSVPMKRLRMSPLESLSMLVGIRSELKAMVEAVSDQDFDIVQAVGAHHYHGPLLARMMQKPLVWQLHSMIMPAPGRRIVAPIIDRLADVIMVNGQTVGRALFGSRRPDDRFKVFYAPVEAARFQADPTKQAQARAQLNLPADAVVVGTVGNRVWQKNHELLLEVSAELVDLYPKLRIVILGREDAGYAASYAKVSAATEKLNERHPGFVTILDPGREVPLLLNAFDVFVLTSRTEGVPITLFEASCTSIPTVSTNVGSIADVVVDGETGFLCPPGDKAELASQLRALAEDGDRRREVGQHARRRIETEFSLAQVEAVHVSAYEKAIAVTR